MKEFLIKQVRRLSGKKTYVLGTGCLVYAAGIKLHWFKSDPDMWQALFGTTAITLRVAIAKLARKAADDTLKDT